jgi:hypothetical protein
MNSSGVEVDLPLVSAYLAVLSNVVALRVPSAIPATWTHKGIYGKGSPDGVNGRRENAAAVKPNEGGCKSLLLSPPKPLSPPLKPMGLAKWIAVVGLRR